MGMWTGIHYFRLHLFWNAPQYKPMWWQGFLTFLFSGSLNSLKQIWLFSAGSCSLFSTSLSSVIDCCGNVRHNCFTSSSMCSLKTSLHRFYRGTFSVDQVHLHKQIRCVHTIEIIHACWSFLYMVSYLFSWRR